MEVKIQTEGKTFAHLEVFLNNITNNDHSFCSAFKTQSIPELQKEYGLCLTERKREIKSMILLKCWLKERGWEFITLLPNLFFFSFVPQCHLLYLISIVMPEGLLGGVGTLLQGFLTGLRWCYIAAPQTKLFPAEEHVKKKKRIIWARRMLSDSAESPLMCVWMWPEPCFI